MRWRRVLRATHRDIGYGVSFLVWVYALSGIAVNHSADWNPTYAIEQRPVALGALDGYDPGSWTDSDLDAMQRHVVRALDLEAVRGRVLEAPGRFVVVLGDGGDVRVNPGTGAGTLKTVRPRTLLYDANALHLNRLKGVWTWAADLFAVLLAWLAMSGVLMLKGPLGIAGRGKWLVGLGVVVPVALVWLSRA